MNNKERLRMMLAGLIGLWLIIGVALFIGISSTAYSSVLTALTILYIALIPFDIGALYLRVKIFTS